MDDWWAASIFFPNLQGWWFLKHKPYCFLTQPSTNSVQTFWKIFDDIACWWDIVFWPSRRQIQCKRFERFFDDIACHFLSCGSGFKILAGVSRLIPSSSGHLSYFPMANALNGLPQLKSGAWTYFVHPPGTMLTLIFFARSEDLTLSFMGHSFIYHKIPKLNVDVEKKISQELY